MPAAPARPSPLRRRLKRLPVFGLYGEGRAPAVRMLHVESIDSRSRLYDWEIDAHVHHGLHQLIWLQQGRVHALLDEAHSDASGPVALAIPPKRSTSALGVFVSIVMVVSYHKVNEYGQDIAALGRVDPFLALWGPFVVFALLIVWMYWRVAHVPGGQAIGALEAFAAKLGKLFDPVLQGQYVLRDGARTFRST